MRPLGFGVGAAAVLCVALPNLPDSAADPRAGDGDGAPPTEVVPVADPAREVVVRAARLLGRHDCWTGDAPADMVGVLPGHVVVTVDRGAAGLRTVHAGDRMVGRALDHLFTAPDTGIVQVHGFCR